MGATFEIPKTLEVGLISLDNKDLSPISMSLKKVGLQNITIYDSLDKAHQFAKIQKNALLIIDVRSQVLMGLEHIKDLKLDSECSNYPIIPVVKTGDQALILPQLKDYGVTEVVTIPLQIANLLQSIRRTLACFLPGEVESQIRAVRFALANGKIDNATQILGVLSDRRRSVRTELGLSHVSLVQNDVDKSRHFLKTAKTLDPESFGVKIGELKQLLHESCQTAEVEECVQAMLSNLSPPSRVGQILRAFYRSGRHSDGFNLAVKFEREFSRDPNLKLWHAKLALKCNRIDTALQFLQKFHKGGQKTLESLNMLGVLQKKKRNMEEAKIAFDEAHRISPNDFRILFNLGLVYEELGDGAQAASCYQKALEIEPEFAKATARLNRVRPAALAG